MRGMHLALLVQYRTGKFPYILYTYVCVTLKVMHFVYIITYVCPDSVY